MEETGGGRNWRQLATGHTKVDAGTHLACFPHFYSETDPQLQDSETHSKWEFSLSDSSEETQKSASELNPPNSIQIQSVDNDEPSHGSL